jgi:hypothetical protein
MTAFFIANREVRTIPKGWQHPRDAGGAFRPLLPLDHESRTEEGRRDLIESGFPIPGEDAYMPALWTEQPDGSFKAPDGVEIAAYETTTEGTPISPAFPDTPEGRLALANWCAEHSFTWGNHKADAETWAGILFGDSVAAVTHEGAVHFA